MMLFIILLLVATDVAALTETDIKLLSTDVRLRVDLFTRPDDTISKKPLLATLVRLTFHDCGGRYPGSSTGICDGCINTEDPDHHGLEYGAVYPLEQMYKNARSVPTAQGNTYTTVDGWSGNPSQRDWSTIMSRADFWHISALLAIEYSNELSWINGGVPSTSALNNPLPVTRRFHDVTNIRYYTGRTDCGSSPFTDKEEPFNINPYWNWGNLLTFFQTTFPDFDEKDTVAILGAHTLGRAHNHVEREDIVPAEKCCSGSGLTGSWKENPDTFDIGYYVDSYFLHWMQRPANKGCNGKEDRPESPSTQLQFKHCPFANANHEGLMLTIDLVIYFTDMTKKATMNTTGAAECNPFILFENQQVFGEEIPPCDVPIDGTKPHFFADAFHQFDDIWKKAFWIAFEKMTTAGYNRAELTYLEKEREEWTKVAESGEEMELWGLDERCKLKRLATSSQPLQQSLSNKHAYIIQRSFSERVPNDELEEGEEIGTTERIIELILWTGADLNIATEKVAMDYVQLLNDRMELVTLNDTRKSSYGYHLDAGDEPDELLTLFGGKMPFTSAAAVTQCTVSAISPLSADDDSFIDGGVGGGDDGGDSSDGGDSDAGEDDVSTDEEDGDNTNNNIDYSCPLPSSSCMNDDNYKECRFELDGGCTNIAVAESCPLQFYCGDDERSCCDEEPSCPTGYEWVERPCPLAGTPGSNILDCITVKKCCDVVWCVSEEDADAYNQNFIVGSDTSINSAAVNNQMLWLNQMLSGLFFRLHGRL